MKLGDLHRDPDMQAGLWRALVAAVAPLLLLGLILIPAWTRVQQAEADLSRAVADLEWLAATARDLPGAGDTLDRSPPTSVDLERILQDAGLRSALRQMTDQAEGRIRLTLNEVEFQRLVQVLQRLEVEHGGALQEISISRGSPGLATATLVLQGAPG